MVRLALIGALLFALPCAGAEEPGPKPQRATDAPATAWLLPALESELVHFSFLAFSNLVTGRAFARISADSIASHFDGRSPWHFDEDLFLTNMLGHPYQGALSFTAARSAGLSFWSASLYAAMGSLTWETFFEVDPPSINDQLTTMLGGVVLGEVLHRSALMVWQDESLPRWLRWVSVCLLEPVGALNRWLFDAGLDERDAVTPTSFGLVGAGAGVSDRADLVLQAWFTYGVFDPRAPPDRAPFSHFDVTMSVSPTTPDAPLGALFIRGLLYGKTIGLGSPRLRGVWGLFGQYDFSQPRLLRVSSIGFGPGAALQWHFSPHGFLQATAIGAVSPFDSIGSLGVDEDELRDYHIGPGVSAVAEARLVHSQAGMLRVVARQWLVVGAYTPTAGWESMTQVTLGVLLKLGWRLGVAGEYVASLREPRFHDATYDLTVRDGVVRLSLCWLSDESFGVLAPLR